MTPEAYRQFSQIARNLGLAVPAYAEPFSSPVWVQFLSRVAQATGA